MYPLFCNIVSICAGRFTSHYRYRTCFLFFLLMFPIGQALFAQQLIRNFSFGKKYAKDDVLITKPQAFSSSIGYGFEFGTENDIRIEKGSKQASLASNKPFYFSVNVPEGNYRVTVGYHGDKDTAYHSTIRSESRRLHVEDQIVPAGKKIATSFIVHIKSPLIHNGESVKLKKPREAAKLDWDDKLTLEFQRTTRIDYIRIEAVSTITTVFLAGNSTVVNQEDEPWASWGQMIPRFFDQQVAIANHAESGLALSSFLSSNRLAKILSVSQPGDYLFIEFGHNDQKEQGEKAGAFHGYAERLRLFVKEFRKKGGIPVIVTSTARRAFDADGNLLYTLGEYPAAARQVAAELDVPLIDLNRMTRAFYQRLGVENSKRAFVHYAANTFSEQPEPLQDNTHFNTYGAYQIAKMVLQGIKQDRLDLQAHIIDFESYDPSLPDDFTTWHWPPGLKNSRLKPDGN